MYINFKLLPSLGLSLEDVTVMQMCKQNKTEDLSEELSKFDFILKRLQEKELVSEIKKGKSKFERKRLTKKGKKVLEDIETPEVTADDLVLFDWLEKLYISQDKEVGNKRKTKMYLALFRVNSGIQKNELATLLDEFTRDEDNMSYNHKLEYAFFKPSNVFQTKFELDQSRLWGYYQKNEEHMLRLFEELKSK